MTASRAKSWMVAYDVRCKRRLGRVHRALKRNGASFQYSVFVVRANDTQMAALMDELMTILDASEDDLRAYHVPEHAQVWTLGRQALPEGVYLSGDVAIGLLVRESGEVECLTSEKVSSCS